jgi:4-nitrophenyl phosphatase
MNIVNLKTTELLIFDLDGVVYTGTQIINHVAESINKFYMLNKKIAFFTNNSTLTTKAYVKKLSNMGIASTEEQFYTSATISADTLIKKYKKQPTAFVVGEEGLTKTLESRNINILNRKYTEQQIIENNSIRCDFVIAGLDRNFNYNKLAAATLLISRKADFFATNNDTTLPDKYGNLPGSGAIVNAISTAVGHHPKNIFGKPYPRGIYQILSDLNVKPEHAIMFGDRPDTDILAGKNAGINTALVLTGITTKENINKVPNALKPDIILNNLSEF